MFCRRDLCTIQTLIRRLIRIPGADFPLLATMPESKIQHGIRGRTSQEKIAAPNNSPKRFALSAALKETHLFRMLASEPGQNQTERQGRSHQLKIEGWRWTDFWKILSARSFTSRQARKATSEKFKRSSDQSRRKSAVKACFSPTNLLLTEYFNSNF